MNTYTTGKTFGNTTLASAKYSYRILWSNSSAVYFTSVACQKKKRGRGQKEKGQHLSPGELLALTTVLLKHARGNTMQATEIKSASTRMVSNRAWILGSVRTSSSRRTLDSDTDTFRR